jgi:hypothetical protein
VSRPAPRQTAPPPQKAAGGGLSIQTLLISSLAAAAAAIVVPMFWEKGSVFATAVTPIIVALVSEALRKPAQVISAVTPNLPLQSRTRGTPETWDDERPEAPTEIQEDPFGLREERAEVADPRSPRKIPWKVGVVTGLVAAVIGAGVVTASELGIGHSIGNSKDRTSVFGGTRSKATPTPTPTATETPAQTATPEATATPTATETATPTATPSVTPTATPTVSATPTVDPNVAPTVTP